MQAKHGRILPVIARDAISNAVNVARANVTFDRNASWLAEWGASFVTLMQEDELRGCIGTVQAYQPLLADIEHNAVCAALHDPRFQPLTSDELSVVRIEVSLWSKTKSLEFVDEPDALAKIRPGIDGIVFEYGDHHSTFLPQVWKVFVRPEQFLAELKLKAGLPGDFWAEDVKLLRYTVSKWREPDLI